MKISKVEPIHISVPYRYGGPLANADAIPWYKMDTLIVKVTTDEGIVGWGEAFGFNACSITRTAIDKAIAPLAIGRDPTDISSLVNEIARKIHNCGRNGPVTFALSGLDIALWDIAGKLANKPLYQLLGRSALIERLPAYASLLRYGSSKLVEQNCVEALACGYSRIKLHEIGVAEIAAARNYVPADVGLMVDTNCPWDVDHAVSMAKAFRKYNILWLEEPIWPPEDYDGLRRVRAEAGVPVAAGENAGTCADLMQLITVSHVDFLQPSMTKIGGITEMLRAAAMAHSHGIALAPHSPFFGPGLIATIHFNASLPHTPHIERFYCDLEASPLGELVNSTDGYMTVPSGPGLGINMDEDVIAAYRVN